jgi:hypothetical protein
VVVAQPVPAGMPMPSLERHGERDRLSVVAVTLARNAVTEPAAALVNE